MCQAWREGVKSGLKGLLLFFASARYLDMGMWRALIRGKDTTR